MEQHLSLWANERFDIEDKMILCDLTILHLADSTNRGITDSKLVDLGRSKAKLTDVKSMGMILMIMIQYGPIRCNVV